MIPARRTYEHGVTATGTVQGDAYQLTTEIAYINSGIANTGVLLTDATIIGGGVHFLANLSGSDKKVYPPVSQSVNGLGSNLPITMATSTGLTCIGTGAGTWYCYSGTMPVA